MRPADAGPSPRGLQQDTAATELNLPSHGGAAVRVQAALGRAEDAWAESSALGWHREASSAPKRVNNRGPCPQGKEEQGQERMAEG